MVLLHAGFDDCRRTGGLELPHASAVTVWVFGLAMAFVWFKIINLITPTRVSREVEIEGLDIPEMGTLGYPDFALKGGDLDA
jgi:Amt family ammonium transporter